MKSVDNKSVKRKPGEQFRIIAQSCFYVTILKNEEIEQKTGPRTEGVVRLETPLDIKKGMGKKNPSTFKYS